MGVTTKYCKYKYYLISCKKYTLNKFSKYLESNDFKKRIKKDMKVFFPKQIRFLRIIKDY